MKTKMKLTNLSEIEATLTITMKLHQWIELRDQLKEQFPAIELHTEITHLIAKVEKEFYSQPEL